MHIKKLFSLDEKCAVVIGGAGKIGFPMAQALAEAGAKVYVAPRNKNNYQPAVEKLKSEKLEVEGITLNQSDEASVYQVVKKSLKSSKHLIFLLIQAVLDQCKNFTMILLIIGINPWRLKCKRYVCYLSSIWKCNGDRR